MQQTTKYKLNLIETSDPFSPAPLNENAQKLEGALSAETAARTAADTAEAQARAQAVTAEAQTRAQADTAEAQARAAAVATLTQNNTALAKRVTALEAHRIVAGSYTGNSQYERFIDLGFNPIAVIVQCFTGGTAGLAVEGNPMISGTAPDLSVAKGGFVLGTDSSPSKAYNNVGTRYHYVAFA